jgi:predicted trehalose synthase
VNSEARRCFLEGYAEGARVAASYPEKEEHVRALVELLMLEKALQEIRCELEKRPDRAGDPLRGLIDPLERKTGEGRE